MAQIAHPNGSGTIDVEVVDNEQHRGVEVAQIQAIADTVELTDGAGALPWVMADELEE
jgi:hypothetical protein